LKVTTFDLIAGGSKEEYFFSIKSARSESRSASP